MTVAARLCKSQAGVAAIEMALVAPFLLALLFGSVEMGKYFMDQHVVVKAVRDGARFAARQPMSNYRGDDAGCADIADELIATQTRNVVRSGNPAGTGSRLTYWTDPETITVSTSCSAIAGGEELGGIYAGAADGDAAVGAPVVTVSVTLPYESLFDFVPFAEALDIRAEQQAVVTGI